MNDKNALSNAINELMDDHGVNAEKLAVLTNIPLRFINSIKNAEFSQLPPEPYVRGYLIKIAQAFKADEVEIIRIYRQSAEAAKSGAKDKLPENRFRKILIARGWLIASAIVALVAVFIFFRFDEIMGISTLQVKVPETTNSEVLTITGSVSPGEQLTLNGEMVYTNGTGRFEKEIMLEPGLNTLEFVVKKFLGRETKIIKTVFYEPLPEPESPASAPQDTPPSGSAQPSPATANPTYTF